MIENGCYHYKNCDDCDFEDCRVVKLQNTIKKQKLKLFAKAYNQGRKETASEIISAIKKRLYTNNYCQEIVTEEMIDEVAKQFGVEVEE